MSNSREDRAAPSEPAAGAAPRSGGSWRTACANVGPPVLLCAILVALCVVQSRLANFWIDEIYTYFVVADPSFTHMLGAEADLINANPPLYFMAAWTWAKVFGVSEVALRLFSCLGFCVGASSLWWLLKRTFGGWPALVGTFVVLLTSEQVTLHNCEARFYGLFFAETLLATCLFAALCERKKAGPGLLLANAVVHGALVTTHYLGFLYCAGFLLAFGVVWARDVRALGLRCGSILAGWLAFLPCVPGFLHHLAFGKPHGWITPPQLHDLIDVYNTAHQNFVPVVLTLVVLALLVEVLAGEAVVQVPQAAENQRISSRKALPLLILALCFLLLPVILWGFSKVFNPMFLARYLLPPLLVSWSVILAFSAQRLCRSQRRRSDGMSAWVRMALATVPQIGFVALTAFAIVFSAKYYLYASAGIITPPWKQDNQVLQAIDELPGDIPIVFVDTHAFFIFEHYSERRRQFVLLVDKDWAFSASPDVPRPAPNSYQIAMALKSRYAAKVREAADFWRENDRAIYLLGKNNQSLFEKQVLDEGFSSKSLFEASDASPVLVRSAVLVRKKNLTKIDSHRAGPVP